MCTKLRIDAAEPNRKYDLREIELPILWKLNTEREVLSKAFPINEAPLPILV
jgi:hypothetical protein